MPVAELVAIGTELLLGEIQDTNTRYLARCLRDVGINLYRATVIGDNAARIAALIREASQPADIVITTGGLGPTVDDPTRAAVADAFGLPLEFHPELWEQILARFQRYGRQATENNRRQAYIPAGALAVENQVGTAPAFIVEQVDPVIQRRAVIICLPGVPREMEYLMQEHILPYLRATFQLRGIIKARVLHTAGVGESQVDEWIGDLEVLENPSVGLLAHPGQVDIRVTAKADSEETADAMLQEMCATVRQRVGDAIYGQDAETLESTILARLETLGWKLAVMDCGSSGSLAGTLVSAGLPGVYTHTAQTACREISLSLRDWMTRNQAQVGIAASLKPVDDKHNLTVILIAPGGENQVLRSYGGPTGNAAAWGTRTALDILRRALNLAPTIP